MSGHQTTIERPKGSLGLDLQQSAAVNNPLYVTAPPAAPMAVDVTDRWARLLGQVDIARANGAAMAAATPLIAGIYDAAGNRMPAMDAVARPGYVDPIDRAARLLGIVYGSLSTLQQRAATFDLYTQIRSGGVEIDPRQIRALVKATDELYSVLRTDAGAAYDARLIRALTAADIIDVSDRAARLLGTVSPVAGSFWDVSDRAARLLGKIYGDTGLLAQRAATLDAYVQLRSAGAEIDPRSIRALISTDILGVVDAASNRMPSMDTVGRAGYHYLTDGTRTAKIDIVEGAQIRIDLAHHMIHDGKGYTCDDYATGLGAGASKYWHFKAPNTAARIHINATIFATDSGIAYFYELPTTTANGTALTPRNNDRNNANASVLSVWKDPTVTADGTQLGVSALGTNNPKTRFGGEAKQNFEWILKQNTAYLLKFTADNAGTAVNLGLEYYEA